MHPSPRELGTRGFASAHTSFSLKKEERLKSKEKIAQLFKNGSAISQHPIRAIFSIEQKTSPFPVKAGFTAPKRKFKKAPDRNLLKRRMREAYRVNKASIYQKMDTANKQCGILFVYISNEIADLATIEKAMVTILQKITAQIETNQ